MKKQGDCETEGRDFDPLSNRVAVSRSSGSKSVVATAGGGLGLEEGSTIFKIEILTVKEKAWRTVRIACGSGDVEARRKQDSQVGEVVGSRRR